MKLIIRQRAIRKFLNLWISKIRKFPNFFENVECRSAVRLLDPWIHKDFRALAEEHLNHILRLIFKHFHTFIILVFERVLNWSHVILQWSWYIKRPCACSNHLVHIHWTIRIISLLLQRALDYNLFASMLSVARRKLLLRIYFFHGLALRCRNCVFDE